ncbi:hypothetical protein BACCAP_03071 [Pseudoflavonifractor capillosus ATCC 29799]|uniref:Uncharacterized protein n=1 Tax=Pseudoflavonifractor capillosus ATCC 29799 TaxID=411467 RepID=A6NXX5_9FIRM|nr:hypothetical protein BACCAP_03071 [Pseudoflavonifractor capillosus ATCC 29799]
MTARKSPNGQSRSRAAGQNAQPPSAAIFSGGFVRTRNPGGQRRPGPANEYHCPFSYFGRIGPPDFPPFSY